MPTDSITHNWQSLCRDWICIPGRPVCIVKTTETPKGFLWQHGKQYGFGKTLSEAKEWAETAREFWPRHLPH